MSPTSSHGSAVVFSFLNSNFYTAPDLRQGVAVTLTKALSPQARHQSLLDLPQGSFPPLRLDFPLGEYASLKVAYNYST
jgi:hypothetical protein